MARKRQVGEVNKSEEFRQLLKANPNITASEAVSALAGRGIKAGPDLFYFVKGKMKGRKGRRRKMRRKVASVMANGAMPPVAVHFLKAMQLNFCGLRVIFFQNWRSCARVVFLSCWHGRH